jgi:ferredoxin
MACIGNCPTGAIEYGTITNGKEPYNIGKYGYVVENIEKNSK